MIIALALLLTSAASALSATDPRYEGDWYVSDMTDNITGEREVEAFSQLITQSDFVTLRMRCSAGKPTIAIEWSDMTFPDKVAVSIAAGQSPDADPVDRTYVFTNSDDPVERGLHAAPDTSSSIVAALGISKYAAITVHGSPTPKLVTISVDGTQRAWSRVIRHCPVQIMSRPPL